MLVSCLPTDLQIFRWNQSFSGGASLKLQLSPYPHAIAPPSLNLHKSHNIMERLLKLSD